jgi:putative addiction module component (TIGR02574 family)
MDLDLEHLAAAVLRLSPAERAELAARLLASLEEDEAERQAYDAAWAAELEQRDRAADADPTPGVSAVAALAEVRADLAARRAARR